MRCPTEKKRIIKIKGFILTPFNTTEKKKHLQNEEDQLQNACYFIAKERKQIMLDGGEFSSVNVLKKIYFQP